MGELGSGSGTGYPAALDTDTTQETTSDKCRADVFNDLADAVVAIETELGTDPAGILTDVKTFLQTEHNTNGTHITSGSTNMFSAGRDGTDQLDGTSPDKIVWDTEHFDAGGDFDLANDKFIAPKAGIYLLGCYVISSWLVIWDIALDIYKNGSVYKSTHSAQGDERSVGSEGLSGSIYAIVEAAANDYFEIYVNYTTGGTRQLSGSNLDNRFFGHYISA